MKRFFTIGVLLVLISRLEAQAVSLHPENQHYFLFKGKPALLVASTEGALVFETYPDYSDDLVLLLKNEH